MSGVCLNGLKQHKTSSEIQGKGLKLMTLFMTQFQRKRIGRALTLTFSSRDVLMMPGSVFHAL